MSDVAPENKIIVEQQAPLKDEQNISKNPENATVNQAVVEDSETQGDPNWRAFREARKRDRAEKEAAERRAAEKEKEVAALKAAMEAAFSKSAPTPQAYQQYYGISEQPEESEDARLEKKVNALLEAKHNQFLKEQEERERREYPTRLVKTYPDFSNVCSQENLDYLDYHYPEISRPLQRLPEGFDKWEDIYRAVKKLIPNQASAKKDAARAEANSMKPKSISSMDLSQKGEKTLESWQESERRRAANWERMQKIMKGIG